MCTIYENIKQLCDSKGIKPGRMCTDVGMSKSILTGLKNGTKKNIQSDTAQKIADYFGVSVDYVLGSEQKEKPTAASDEPLDPVTQKIFNIIDAADSDKRKKILALLEVADSMGE